MSGLYLQDAEPDEDINFREYDIISRKIYKAHDNQRVVCYCASFIFYFPLKKLMTVFCRFVTFLHENETF